MKRTPTSPWGFDETISAAQASGQAGLRHSNKLVARLGETFFDSLANNTQTLISLNTGRFGAVEEMKGKTRELKVVVAEASGVVTAIRSAITAQFPPGHPVRAHFGVGIRNTATSMKFTLESLQRLISGMENYPAEAAQIGLTPDDLTKLKGYREEILLADASQEESKDRRKATTALAHEVAYSLYQQLNRLKLAAALDLGVGSKAYNEIVGPLPGGTRSRKKTETTPVTE